MTQKIIVSKPGYDARTETNPDNLIFSSDYNTLKYYVNGGVDIAVYVDTEGYYSFTKEIIHGLGYKPFFKTYAFLFGYSPTGIFTIVDNHNIHVSSAVDDNKIYFIVSGYNAGASVPTGLYGAFSTFLVNYYGQFVDFDGFYGYQCVDLINQWCFDALGITDPIAELPGATAAAIYAAFTSDAIFDKIDYVAGTFPQLGDIVFWGSGYVGGDGHTGVATSIANSSSFDCFEQNDPVGQSCLIKTYNYNNVVGWLRFKNQGGGTVTPDIIDLTVNFKYKLFKNSLGL